MLNKQLSRDISKLTLLIDRYEKLANSTAEDDMDLKEKRLEMKLAKEQILSLIIDAKKGITKIEVKAKI